MAKMGRPTENPKRRCFNVRLDDKCERIVREYAEQEKISRTEAVRRGIAKLEAEIKKTKE